MLTIFYDGNCPLCVAEMNHLKQYDKDKLITLINIHNEDFTQLYPNIDFTNAMKILHGTYQGRLLLGLEVTHRAWTIAGKGFWVAPLNWPVIKPLSHLVYLCLAKYRHPVASFFATLLGLKTTHCHSGTCHDNSTNSDHRRK